MKIVISVPFAENVLAGIKVVELMRVFTLVLSPVGKKTAGTLLIPEVEYVGLVVFPLLTAVVVNENPLDVLSFQVVIAPPFVVVFRVLEAVASSHICNP